MKIEHEPEVFRLGEGQICIPLGAKEIAVLTDNDSFQSKRKNIFLVFRIIQLLLLQSQRKILALRAEHIAR